MPFADKVALVTGVADGQGRAAVQRLIDDGATVFGCDVNTDGARETAELVASDRYHSMAPVDLTDEDDVNRMMDEVIGRAGHIDLLYNNAAAARLGRLSEMAGADAEFTLRGVIAIPFLVSRTAAPHMRGTAAPAIVNIASIAGIVGSGMVGNAPHLGIYSAAKAAVIRITQLLAIELAPLGIRVNAVSPGLIDTPAVAPILGRGAAPDERLEGWITRQLLIRRIGIPDDVIDAAMFLLSDRASYVTGQNLIVDGGWTASGGVGWPHEDVVEALDASFSGGFKYQEAAR